MNETNKPVLSLDGINADLKVELIDASSLNESGDEASDVRRLSRSMSIAAQIGSVVLGEANDNAFATFESLSDSSTTTQRETKMNFCGKVGTSISYFDYVSYISAIKALLTFSQLITMIPHSFLAISIITARRRNRAGGDCMHRVIAIDTNVTSSFFGTYDANCK